MCECAYGGFSVFEFLCVWVSVFLSFCLFGLSVCLRFCVKNVSLFCIVLILLIMGQKNPKSPKSQIFIIFGPKMAEKCNCLNFD